MFNVWLFCTIENADPVVIRLPSTNGGVAFFNHPFQILNLKNLISCSPKNLMQPSKLSHHGPGPSRCFLRELDCTFRCTTSRKKQHDVHVRGRGVEARIGDGFPVHIAEHHVISRKMI